ncbi:hypothetical protein WKI71_28940 [Streptomyces sp. MS1.AVA.1]|uniref:Uncharacterized protein n=1 Tax=Streptomyces machairae TaxID=3134109 RepID=A0ABU8UQZ3_9ACTN
MREILQLAAPLDEPQLLPADPHPVVGRHEQRPSPLVELSDRLLGLAVTRRPTGCRPLPRPPPAPQEPVSRERGRGDDGQHRHHQIRGRRPLVLPLSHRTGDRPVRPARNRTTRTDRHPGQHQPHHPDQPAHQRMRDPHRYVRTTAPRPAPDRR